ncbi:hypothetical protein ABIE87_005376 [Bradyrhizobium diazoefficiens]
MEPCRRRGRQRRRHQLSQPNEPTKPQGLNVPSDAIWAWSIIVAATAGVIIRPFRLPEAIWAVIGAGALVLLGLLPWQDALLGIEKGVDVYLFLIGMMLIAELARLEGLFDYLAALAVEYADGSPQRLFLLIYLVGTLVTVLLSNDATAIVLTPAVYAATRAAGAKPLPYLFVCAFIANAASFVLPISNPANLVVFGARMPHLTEWLRLFALPSAASILLTYVVLRLTQHRALKEETIARSVPHSKLSPRRQAHSRGHHRDRNRAGHGLRARQATRLADLHLRRGDVRDRAANQPAVTFACAARRVLERAAAGRRALRPGGSAGEDRRDRAAQRAAAPSGRAIDPESCLERRHRDRIRHQCRQQSSGRPRRRLGRRQRSFARARRQRHPDRRRPRPQSVGNGVARHHPLAGRAAAGRRSRLAPGRSSSWVCW